MSDEEVTPEPAQLFELPEFEGQVPVGVNTRLSGTGQRITRPLRIGDRVITVVECEVVGVNHVEDKGGLKRIQTLTVKDLYEAEGKDGLRLLSSVRMKAKQAEDARSGRQTLPGIDTAPDLSHGLTLDGSGTAMTDAEVAAARGEELPAEEPSLDNGPVPVVLIFSDESRALYPDDFPAALAADPFAGDFLVNPNNRDAGELQITKVLDVEDGETLEEWKPEDENRRLKELEDKALAEESAAPKPKKKSKKKAPAVIVDEITPALEEDAKVDLMANLEESLAPALPGEDE